MKLGDILKGGFLGYFGNIVSLLIGYIYWIIASRFVEPEIIGNASAIIALSSVIVSIFSLGLDTGIKRFIGITYKQKDFSKLSEFFFSSFAILICINLPIFVFLVYVIFFPVNFISFNSLELTFLTITFLLNFLSPLFVSLFISILKLKAFTQAHLISAVVKISLGVIILVYLPNLHGLMFSFILSLGMFNLVLIINSTRILFRKSISPKINFKLSKEIIFASLPAYLPNVLIIFGQSLGILIMYGFIGSYETGLYFIAFSIATVVYAIPQSIESLIYPILSTMEDGREKCTNQVINLSLIISVPIIVIVAIYASIPLSLFGSVYLKSEPILLILLCGALFFPMYSGYYSYLYAREKYTHVIILGMFFNGSRILLYYLLAFLFGSFGIALSYSLAVIFALIAMVISARLLRFELEWISIVKIMIIPISIGFFIYFFKIYWFIGIPLIIVISFVIYIKMNIFSKQEYHQIISAFISEEKTTVLYQKTQKLIHFLFK